MTNAIKFNDQLSFEDYINVRDALQARINETSEALKQFPRSASGLVSDKVRSTFEYRSAKIAYDVVFSSLQNLNKIYVKKYKKELAQLRASKWKSN